ncbi:MAG: hypothetical protein K2P84_05480, partial [Undibacterium sp.]|nr:hypothetical protein [Undibacterium sp.]
MTSTKAKLPNQSRLCTMIGAILLTSALYSPVHAADQAWVTKSNDNAKLLLQLMGKYSPEGAGAMGVDGLDEQIIDMSRDLFDVKNKETLAVIRELQKRLKAETNGKIKQDLQILIGSAEDGMRSDALSRQYFIPFDDMTRLIFG